MSPIGALERGGEYYAMTFKPFLRDLPVVTVRKRGGFNTPYPEEAYFLWRFEVIR